MPIDFRNVNTIWSSVLAETLHRLGLTTAVICPGSRSAPLAIALAQHPHLEAIPVLDERSASFFALGLAQQTHRAVILVCTSGTAGANFYPAVIEARESCIPLLILTADRPPELRHCNAGQTIDQQKLYGDAPNWYAELALPTLDLALLAYLRQTVSHAWARSHTPVPGPVHLNLPFRDPLAPLPDLQAQTFATTFNPTTFFTHLSPAPTPPSSSPHPPPPPLPSLSPRLLILAGVAHPTDPLAYCQALAHLAHTLNCPVLAEGLSPVRNYASLFPGLVSTYDAILRDADWATALAPDGIIRVGDMPTSKVLRQWIEIHEPMQWVIDPGDRNLDPTHSRTQHLRYSIEQFTHSPTHPLTHLLTLPLTNTAPSPSSPPSTFLKNWIEAEQEMRQTMDTRMAACPDLFEGKIAWVLSQWLPEGTPVFIANSTPVRDVEWFWRPGDRHIQPYFNRGANGIDGTLSTALGIAHRNQSSVLLTGDLSFLHDTNGLLLSHKLQGHLTVVLINNSGGGIFGLLPIAQFDPPFEEFFATPQAVDVAVLCSAYGVSHERVESWEILEERLTTLPRSGVRVLEIRCDRKRDAPYRKTIWHRLRT